MKKTVVKFGGSVLRSVEDIERVGLIIQAYDRPVIAVVSAFYGITDLLSDSLKIKKISTDSIEDLTEEIRTIHYRYLNESVHDPLAVNSIGENIDILLKELHDHLTGTMLIRNIPDQSKAFILSFGERLSSVLISDILRFKGLDVISTSPESAEIYSSGPILNATIDLKRSAPGMIRAFSGERSYIVPGFYGIPDMERISLFGRGGSDYSAAGIAAGIGAASCDLWKDVNGFMTADPSVEALAKNVPALSYGEAAELSYFGAAITHPETYTPLEQKSIPLNIYDIRQFKNEKRLPLPSTVIGSRTGRTGEVIKSITGSVDFSILRIKGSGVGIHPGIISDISNRFSEEDINIRSIITSQTTINFLLSAYDIRKAFSIIERLKLPEAEVITTETDIALIAAVGYGFRETYGVAANILTVLSEKKINVTLMTAGASDSAIYLTIRKNECEKAIKSLHKEFFQ
ncbi:MAG: aspartate kinase [Acidobacteriota bacterium]